MSNVRFKIGAASAPDDASHSVEGWARPALQDATGDAMQMIETVIMFLPGHSIILLPLEAAYIPIKGVGTYAPPANTFYFLRLVHELE
ncbi:MAG TPA: hypothetical protein VMX16_16195 [Terriglobia bacterium]|nr:hypothetical protein [Terriglobia bacterium]